jgi:ADP-ribosyl-[dinitrogen reductase] hydrolase
LSKPGFERPANADATDAGLPDAAERHRGALLGLAAGDAVGTTLEFRAPGSFEPISDMLGGGPFRLAPGEWTDDTSMALCLATSLVARGGFDARDQMARYCRWMEEGYLSSNGRCFDIGNTVRAALHAYRRTGEPFSGSTAPDAAGNGSLMRLAPVVLFAWPDAERALALAGESSRTTHGAAECVEGCRLFAASLLRALGGASREEILRPVTLPLTSPALRAIARLETLARPQAAVRGTGYVVHCLLAALWCFARTSSFRDAVLLAANLGDDADTTAAVCGQLAGAHYGAGGIPEAWREKLVMRAEIEALADRLREA